MQQIELKIDIPESLIGDWYELTILFGSLRSQDQEVPSEEAGKILDRAKAILEPLAKNMLRTSDMLVVSWAELKLAPMKLEFVGVYSTDEDDDSMN